MLGAHISDRVQSLPGQECTAWPAQTEEDYCTHSVSFPRVLPPGDLGGTGEEACMGG